MSTMLEHALAYAAAGLKVFPVWWWTGTACACGRNPCGIENRNAGKHPITNHGLSEATANPATIRAWWTEHPLASIAVAMKASGLLAFDVDDYKGDGDRLAAKEDLIGSLPDTIVQRSGSGKGMHIIVLAPDFPIRGHLDQVTMRANAYIILAPSTHKSGGRYEWIDGRAPGQVPVATLPPAWLEAVRRPVELIGDAGVPPEASEPEWLRAVSHDDRVRAMREHLARERGERMGVDAPGTMWNVARQCARGYAIRHPGDVLEGMQEIYNPKCVPAYAEERVVRAVGKAYDEAMHPPWGERFMPRAALLGADALGGLITEQMKPPDPTGAVPASAPGAAAAPSEWGMTAGTPSVILGTRAGGVVDRIIADSKLPVVLTPFARLNDKLGGLAVHSTTIIVAGSGKGKSSLAGELAGYHSVTAPCLYYVGEMTLALMTGRIVGQRLRRSWLDVVRGRVSEAEMHAVLDPLHLWMIPRQPDPVAAIKATLIAAQEACPKGTPMVVIDYVQLLADVSKDMRISTMAAVRGIQTLVETTDVVCIALSQASRNAATRIRDGAENAEELGDTGAETAELERSATNQLVLSYTSKDDVEEHDVTMLVTKSRFGGGTRLGFKFHGKSGRWAESDRAPLMPGDVDRDAEILDQLLAHESHRCFGGAGCGQPFTANALVKPRGPHKVSGAKQSIASSLGRLVDARRIYKIGTAYAVGAGPTDQGNTGV